MIILHAASLNNQLLLWGETPAAEKTSSKKRSRSKMRSQGKSYPFDAGFAALGAALQEGAVGLTLEEKRSRPGTIWLPTKDKMPVASSPLIAGPPASRAQATLAPWTITTYPLSTEEALHLLCACVGKRTLASGVVVSADLAYWAEALRYAGSLVARQQYLPGLVVEGKAYRAQWEPVFIGDDAERLATLAKRMLPVARALSTPDSASPPERPALSVLKQFITVSVDYLIRTGSSKESLPARRRRQQKSSFDSIHDAWLHALRAPEGLIAGNEADLAQLATHVREWRRPVAVSAASPFRLCFRLEDPDEFAILYQKRLKKSVDTWYVRYLLHPHDDPSLLIPVEDTWKMRGRKAFVLKRYGSAVHEYLLSALGQATGICPRMIESLKTAEPAGYILDTIGAHEFLTEKAMALEQSGFGVMLPAWWTRKGTKMRLAVRANVKSPKMQGGSGLSLDQIVQFNWEIALGDKKLTLRELETLARLKAPLVQLRGQWVQINAAEIQVVIDFWKKKASGTTRVRDVIQMALGAKQTNAGFAFAGVQATGWIGTLLEQLEGRTEFEKLTAPKAFSGTLRPYQIRGYSWLSFLRQWGLGACLADDMGLGKCLSADSLLAVNGTLQTAEALWEIYAEEIEFGGEGFWAVPTTSLLVNALNEYTGHITLSPIRRLYRQYIREKLRRIRLADGSSITITRRHHLLTHKGWTNDFQVGDYVCVPAKIEWGGQSEDPNLIKFLAWQIAEGYEVYDRGTVRIYQEDLERLERLQQTLQDIGKRYNLQINHPSIKVDSGKTPFLVVNSRAYQRFLEVKGYSWGKLSREKTIPHFIMQADLNSVRLFLKHYFDAEAAVVPSMQSIEISTASPLLIQQLVFLLRRFGIWLRISTKRKRATNGTGIFRTYYIGVIGGNAARKFRQEIGFINYNKQQRLEEICSRVNNTNIEGIPASDIMGQIVKTTRLPVRHFGMHNTIYLNGTQQFSRASLEKVVAAVNRVLSGEAEQHYRQQKLSKWTIQTLEAYAHLDKQQLSITKQDLQKLLDQEVFYCKIKSIEEVDYEGWAYDFEVEGHHNFVANNILCHNTIQTLTLLQRDWEANGKRPVLLMCPTSVVNNWQKEAARFTPELPVLIHHGIDRKKGAAFKKAAQKHAIVISSYGLLQRDAKFLQEVSWAGVVLDEAQNIKNPETKQARAARSLNADYRIALTGTPVENNVGDLWSIMEFLNPGFLGTQAEFKRNFFIPIQAGRDPEAAERLKRITGPFLLRRLKTDKAIISDLPDKLEMKVFCTLTKEQASLYAAVLKEMEDPLASAEGIQRRGMILGILSKLKQVCNHPAQFLSDNSSIPARSGKLARLTEMLEEIIAVGDRTLVFSQFAEMGEILQRHLQEIFGREVLFLHGGVPKRQRDRMVERFQSTGDGPSIFILSLKAGGTGLNLTRANHVFHFDRWWNPAVENQATDRVFRIGQMRNVQVHKFICAGTLEEKIDEMIERKQEVAEKVIGTGEGWLTELSNAELKEVFSLRKEAIGE